MDDLFRFFLTNAAIVLGIVGWVYSMFKQDKDRQKTLKEAESKRSTQSTTKTDTSSEREVGTDLQTYAERKRERYNDLSSPKQTAEEQYNALEEQPQHNHYKRDERTPYQREDEVPYERDEATPYKRDHLKPYRGDGGKPKVKLTGVQKLSQKKLAQSLIMAEVLGPPRSQKPYRSK